MRFQLLGSLRAWQGDEEVQLGAAKQRALLARLLLAAPQTVSREEIIDAIWGEHPPASAVNLVQTYVRKLRRTLDRHHVVRNRSGWLSTRSAGYQVLPAQCEIDLLRFRAKIDEAARHPIAGQSLSLLVDALGMWHGPCLSDLPPDVRERVSVRNVDRERVNAVVRAATTAASLGRSEEVLPHLQAVAVHEPLDEAVHAHLVQALALTGAQAEALDGYHNIARRLRDELGVDPSPQLRTAHEQVLRQESRAAQRSAPGVWYGRRPAPSGLVGRDDDVRELTRLIPERRVTVLTGAGGVGKTSLALAAADRVAPLYADGVVVAELGPLPDEPSGPEAEHTEIIADAVRGALGLAASGAAVDDVTAELRQRRMLLLVDNAEHVVRATRSLLDLLVRECSALSVVVTSRVPLGMSDELIREVTPLAVPAGDPVLSGGGSMDLFLRRAGENAPDVDLSNRLGTVAELCRRLDGLPLAIELAAARLRTMSATALLERIERHGLLSTPGAAGLPHHRSLEASVRWSIDLLEPDERLLLERLTVFAGEFTLETAEQVTGSGGLPVAELLGTLVNESLVQISRGDEYRYRLLIPIREVCRSLAGGEELEAVRGAHLRFYRDLALSLEHDDAALARRLRADFPDVIAALDWGFRSAFASVPEQSVELLAAARPLWDREVGQIDAVRRWTAQALSWEESLRAEVRGRLLHWAGRLAYVGERFTEARILLDRALRYVTGDSSRRLDIMQGIASISDALLEPDTVERARAVVASARELASPARITAACASAAVILAWWGKPDLADDCIREASEAAAGDSDLATLCHWSQTIVALRDGRLGVAEEAAGRVLAVRHDAPPDPVIYALLCQAWVRVLRGEPDRSFALLSEARVLSEEAHRSFLVPEINECLAYGHWKWGQTAEAEKVLAECLRDAIAFGDLGTALRGLHLAVGLAVSAESPAASELLRLVSICRRRSGYPAWPVTAEEWAAWEASIGAATENGPIEEAYVAQLISEAARIFIDGDRVHGQT